MDHRENYIRMLEFRNPEWIPCETRHMSIGYWLKYGEQRMDDLILSHPLVFPQGLDIKPDLSKPAPGERTWRDAWGIVRWEFVTDRGGQAIEHPLADWGALKDYRFPDLETEVDWAEEKRLVARRRQKGIFSTGYIGDLFTFVISLRGFENLMIDFATDDPHLPELYERLCDYQMQVMERYLALGVDIIHHHDDLGSEDRLTISPAQFRKYIKPYLRRLFQRARGAGAHVFLSSDGYHLDIVDDLIEIGVSIHDAQMCNPMEGLKRLYKGRLPMLIRLDAQRMPFLTPDEVTALVKQVVSELSDRRGGLAMNLGIYNYPDTPLENFEAACVAFERYCPL